LAPDAASDFFITLIVTRSSRYARPPLCCYDGMAPEFQDYQENKPQCLSFNCPIDIGLVKMAISDFSAIYRFDLPRARRLPSSQP
jgi:hypothetical protein